VQRAEAKNIENSASQTLTLKINDGCIMKMHLLKGEVCYLFGTSGTKWKSRKSRILHFLKREWCLSFRWHTTSCGLLPRYCYVVARAFWMLQGVMVDI